MRKRTVFTVLDLPVTRVRGIPHQHKILVYAPKLRILDYPALWLSEKEYSSGERYVKSLQRFSNHLAAKVFIHAENILLEWWLYVDKNTLIKWKISRIEKRRMDGGAKPSNPHIDVDAHYVFVFLNWLKFDKGILGMSWDGSKKTILTKTNNLASPTAGMFGPNTREVSNDTTGSSVPYDSYEDINVSPNEIAASASEKQFEGYAYLSDVQVKEAIDTCPDKVYKYILLTGYITGLRTHEVLAVPRYEVYSDSIIFSAEPTYIRKEIDKIAKYNDKRMDTFRKKNEELVNIGKKPLNNFLKPKPKLFQMIKKTLGKRNKLRRVRFNLYSWQKIMENWWPIYNERKKLYEAKYGRLPMHILWLDNTGEPIYAPPGRENARWRGNTLKKVQDAFRYVNKLLKSKSEEFEGVNFSYYCIRHTYATNYILRLMMAEGIEKTRDQWLTDLRVRAFLAVQLGHDDVNTTYNCYVDKAMLMYQDMGKGWEKREFDFIGQLLGETTKVGSHTEA